MSCIWRLIKLDWSCVAVLVPDRHVDLIYRGVIDVLPVIGSTGATMLTTES
jgi:hypothetical protein